MKFLNFANGKQFGEFIGLQQNIVCARGIRHQDSDSETNFESESKFDFDEATSETDSTWILYDDYSLVLPRTKIPKGRFNHQSVGSSVSFSVGRKLPSFASCVALKLERKDYFNVPYEYELCRFTCSVYMCINGFERWLTGFDFNLAPSSFMWFYYRRDSSLKGIILEDWNEIQIRHLPLSFCYHITLYAAIALY